MKSLTNRMKVRTKARVSTFNCPNIQSNHHSKISQSIHKDMHFQDLQRFSRSLTRKIYKDAPKRNVRHNYPAFGLRPTAKSAK